MISSVLLSNNDVVSLVPVQTMTTHDISLLPMSSLKVFIMHVKNVIAHYVCLNNYSKQKSDKTGNMKNKTKLAKLNRIIVVS